MKFHHVMLALGCAVSLVLAGASAQTPPPSPPDKPIDGAIRAEVVETLAKEMAGRYVFADKGSQVADALRAAQKRGEFDKAASAQQLSQALTQFIQGPTQDKHLRVYYSERALPPRSAPTTPSAEELDRQLAYMRAMNFGIEKIERLPGNIGYLDLRNFHDAGASGEAIAAAMTLLANSDALIVDLRKNGGGDPATVALMTSYLFDERKHLNDLVWRGDEKTGPRTEHFWTQEWVPGKKFGGKKDVYVLTSKRTFSGAEEFSYNLKNLKRATLIGETTGGGAHPGDEFRLHPHFAAFIATGRAESPITKTNWEGTGVKPDIDMPAEKALVKAQTLALAKLIAVEQDQRRKQAMSHRLADLEKEAAK
jgi:C-terminal processing protease CtpA/Prc